jgi:6-phosphogluconolactonase/glucosamine-6-phosphate isomerase/deaminase
MTLTYPVLDRAACVLWLISGVDKAPALRQLMARDTSVPAGRVRAADQVVMADRSAADG